MSDPYSSEADEAFANADSTFVQVLSPKIALDVLDVFLTKEHAVMTAERVAALAGHSDAESEVASCIDQLVDLGIVVEHDPDDDTPPPYSLDREAPGVAGLLEAHRQLTRLGDGPLR